MRIAPNEIHLSDYLNYDKIYSIGSKFLKDPEFYGVYDLRYAILVTIPEDLHRRQRAALGPFFSRRMVLQMEDIIQEKVATLCRRVEDGLKRAEPVDLHTGFRSISIDVVTDYAFDNCWDHLCQDDLGAWFTRISRGLGMSAWVFQLFPFLAKLMKSMPPWLARTISPEGYRFMLLQTVREITPRYRVGLASDRLPRNQRKTSWKFTGRSKTALSLGRSVYIINFSIPT